MVTRYNLILISHPKTKSEKALFAEIGIFIYDVFQNKLQADMGKHLVWMYEGTDDAESVYRKLAEHTNQMRKDLVFIL